MYFYGKRILPSDANYGLINVSIIVILIQRRSNMTRVLNARETANYIGRSINNTLQMLHDGTIPSIRVDKRWMVNTITLDEWLVNESLRQSKQRKEKKL